MKRNHESIHDLLKREENERKDKINKLAKNDDSYDDDVQGVEDAMTAVKEVKSLEDELQKGIDILRERHNADEYVIKAKKDTIESFKTLRHMSPDIQLEAFLAYYRRMCPDKVITCPFIDVKHSSVSFRTDDDSGHEVCPLYCEEVVDALFGPGVGVSVEETDDGYNELYITFPMNHDVIKKYKK